MKLWLNVSEGVPSTQACAATPSTPRASAARLHHIRIGGQRSIRLKREWIDQWFERHARQGRGGAPTGLAG